MSSDKQVADIDSRVISIIDDYVRPYLMSHGGSIDYIGFEDGVVYIKLLGACDGCPSSNSTLSGYIEGILIDEIKEVVCVRGV